MRRSFLHGMLVLLLVLGAGCARPQTQPQSSPPEAPPAAAPVTAPAAPPTAPTIVGFTVQVDDQELLPNSSLALDEPPADVTVGFPVAMDRALTEKALRGNGLPLETRFTWADDRTLQLGLPEAAYITIDAKGAFSQDGTSIADSRPRYVSVSPMEQIRLYRLPDLLAGQAAPFKTYRLRTAASGVAFAPDGQHALFYTADPFGMPSPLRLVHLPSGTKLTPPVPEDKVQAWYCCGGWLPDGRLYLIGQGKFVVGDTMGKEMRILTESVFAWTAHLSPDGMQMALWRPADTGNAVLVDLTTGARREIPGSFRPQAQDGISRLAWSPDGKLLAGTEGSGGRPEPPRIRIVDVASGNEVGSIPGYMLVGWLPSGDLLAWAWRQAGRGDAEIRADLLSPTGEVKRSGLETGLLSPDGKWVAYYIKDSLWGLQEIATGRRIPLPSPGSPGWKGNDVLFTVK